MANSLCNWYMLNPRTRFDQDLRCSHITKMFYINFVNKCSKRCLPGCTEREQGPVYFAGRRYLPCGNNHQMSWCLLCHILLMNDKSEWEKNNLFLRQIIQVQKCRQFKPGLHKNVFGTAPVWIWPRCLKFAARHPPFLSCKWKNSWHECPKTYGGQDYLSTWSRHPYVLGDSCHEFFRLHYKNGGCRAANFRHRGQIQAGTVPNKLLCKPSFRMSCLMHTWRLLTQKQVLAQIAWS